MLSVHACVVLVTAATTECSMFAASRDHLCLGGWVHTYARSAGSGCLVLGVLCCV